MKLFPALCAGLLLCLSTCITFAAEPAATPMGKKRVLLLGDSISIGYTPFVKEALAKEADVFRPSNKSGGAENCAGTTNGVEKIDDWLSRDGGKWDVIHVNFGLHDLKHVDSKTGKNSDSADSPRQAEPAQYEKNLREIAAKLKKTGAKVIWASTTPVPEGKLSPHRVVSDVAEYNAIAARIAKDEGFAIDDLYAFAGPKLKEIQRPQNVHFTPEGSQALAGEVVKSIRAALKATK